MTDALVLCRFLHFTVVLMLFGAWVFRPLLLGRETVWLDPSLARVTRWLAAIALISGVGWLLLITASMAGSADAAFDPATLGLVLSNTFFGQVWRWHLLLNLLLMALLLTPWRSSTLWRISLSSLLLATLAPVGHGAMLDGLQGQLLILNQIIHLACVGAWLGGLMLLVMILCQPADHPLSAILRRFSGIGYALVAGLVMTGLINVRVLTGVFWPTPLLSGFALILLIKVVLVIGMLGLALFNWLRVKDCQQRLGQLRASVMLEWLLGIGAVAAVSLLGTMPPMITA
ncbi:MULTISPECIES: copper homeostasis membrane protein CopD [Gammaproteobacteria]|uniref:copper homeostasis membrane protein CopD n=1 Tax=Gammaproteobacteria TaxID=1236 RepID=UPI00191248BC|nr:MULTISPECIES: copper homeostasis membrane protein CopD [Gammaproteobacteria]MBK5301018.1 copper homeostasis membrane protein CopD [Bacillus sp. TH86]MBK5320787.1 copper homeostasis membrane protein CopD [Bacillus sp. TH59]MBK5335737.1 copper homeostasis membrane protein CopD [Bacillus sp. TH57]MBK5309814.1 copper homeostasis membrane protein CopD [Pseudomonas sp. TH71]MBK5315286.1 copper homeostasis membrane protein CopD [Erwinia sp. TH79]